MANKSTYVGNDSDITVLPKKIYVGDNDDTSQIVSKIYVGGTNNKSVQVWPNFVWDDVYQKCEYLYNTAGTEWINLLLKPNSNTRALITAMFISYTAASYEHFVMSAGDEWGIAMRHRGSSARELMTRFNQDTYTSTGNVLTYNFSSSTDQWAKHTYDFNRSGGYFYIDNTNIGQLQNTFSNLSNNITLWHVSPAGQWGADAKAYIYSCKIYQNDNLVRDLIPCYRKSDYKPGLYDLVNDVFYTNVGSGEFYKGPDV